jgi:AraC-like DNA-binding protein
MSFIVEQRTSDSPCVELITRGHTTGTGTTIRPAEIAWHMVFVRYNGKVQSLVVGPLTSAGVVSFTAGAEILWIKFKLGVFMPRLPATALLNSETPLPGAASQSFWLHSMAWRWPDYENADTFVDRLVREEVVARDPIVEAVLQQRRPALSPRTLRHRFLRATGLSHNQIQQVKRAQLAERLLRQGRSIFDTVDEAGYSDQPHLTRSLKHWIGYTPAQLVRLGAP